MTDCIFVIADNKASNSFQVHPIWENWKASQLSWNVLLSPESRTLQGIFDECLTTPPPVSNLSGCWRQMGAVPYTAVTIAVCRNALPWRHGTYLLSLPTLFTHSLYCPHLGTNLLVFVFAYVGCLLPFSHPFLLRLPFLFSMCVFLSSLSPVSALSFLFGDRPPSFAPYAQERNQLRYAFMF